MIRRRKQSSQIPLRPRSKPINACSSFEGSPPRSCNISIPAQRKFPDAATTHLTSWRTIQERSSHTPTTLCPPAISDRDTAQAQLHLTQQPLLTQGLGASQYTPHRDISYCVVRHLKRWCRIQAHTRRRSRLLQDGHSVISPETTHSVTTLARHQTTHVPSVERVSIDVRSLAQPMQAFGSLGPRVART